MFSPSRTWLELFDGMTADQQAAVLRRLRDDMAAALIAYGETAAMGAIPAIVDKNGDYHLGMPDLEMAVEGILLQIRKQRGFNAHVNDPDYELLNREQIDNRW